MAFETEKQARSIGETRKNQARLNQNKKSEAVTLEDLFSKIKDGAKEINVIIKADVNGSSEAVKNALESGKLDCFAADVLSSEPMSKDCPLLGCENTIITPHVAWAGYETRQRLMKIAVNNLKSFLDGNIQNQVF
jgi:glycerate dehydrogenase